MALTNQRSRRIQSRKGIADLVIEGGTAITMAEDQEPIREATVIVEDGRITDIGRTDQVTRPKGHPIETIDARDAIIMPGLINAHTHTAMTLFRGFADDLPLRQWLFEKIFPAEARFLSPETVYQGALLGCLEMIASGTTCFADGYFFQDQTIRAAHEAGLRALVAQGVIDFPAPGIPDPGQNICVAEEFLDRWLGFSDLITPGVFCHSPLTCSDLTLRDAWKISNERSLPIQIHLSETAEEVQEIIRKTGKRPVEYLDQIGLIAPGLIASHGVHLSGSEMECMGEKGVKMVHVPESNMKLGSGVAKVTRMMRIGLTVGLGTDGCSSNNDLDLFCEMDSAAKLAKVFDLDPLSLKAEEVLKMATVWGATVLGLEKEIGTLEKGKKADIIVVDLSGPHLCPVYNPISALVYSANGADVRDVIVNGRILMKDRKFISLDQDEVLAKAREISVMVGAFK